MFRGPSEVGVEDAVNHLTMVLIVMYFNDLIA